MFEEGHENMSYPCTPLSLNGVILMRVVEKRVFVWGFAAEGEKERKA